MAKSILYARAAGPRGSDITRTSGLAIAEQLAEIKEEIKRAVHEARDLLPRGTHVRRAAEAYWYAHLLGALDDDHEFLGGSMHTMQDTIEALKSEEGDQQ